MSFFLANSVFTQQPATRVFCVKRENLYNETMSKYIFVTRNLTAWF